MALYKTGLNRTPRRLKWTGIGGTTQDTSSSVIISVDSCPFPTQPFCSIWNGRIGDIRQTITPDFIKYSEFSAPNDRILTNESIFLSIISQIFRVEFSDSFSINIYLRYRMKVETESVQPIVPQFVSHGLPTIDHWMKTLGSEALLP